MFTSSIFAQLLKLIPRDTVAQLVKQQRVFTGMTAVW